MQSFGELLTRALAAQRMNQKQFAALAKVHPTLIGKLIKGARPPNWKRADEWAALLSLQGAEAEDFKDAMHLAAAPPRVLAMVERLRKRTAKPTDERDERAKPVE